MKVLILSIMLSASAIATAQTKLIFFKSISGNMANFHAALIGDPEMMNHNLGMAPEPFIRTSELDSVIRVDDTTTIMVTTRYCRDRYNVEDDPKIWSEGSDTIYNDPLWNVNNKDSVRDVLKTRFYFHNNVDCTKFIGFSDPIIDNDVDGEPDNQQVVPAQPHQNDNDMSIPIAIVGVGVLSIIIGLVGWRRRHFKESSWTQYA